jgi:ketosteroid isomerase-like protein
VSVTSFAPRRQVPIPTGTLVEWFAATSASIVCSAALAAPPSNATAVAEVTKLESTLEQLYNSPQFAKDPSVALVYYDNTDAMRMFDVMLPVEFRGKEFRKHFIEVGTQFTGGKVEFSQLEVTADGQLAFAASIQHFYGKGKDGKPYDMTLRVTDCLRKTGGRWVIVHEHASLPLDAPTFMSVITPKP